MLRKLRNNTRVARPAASANRTVGACIGEYGNGTPTFHVFVFRSSTAVEMEGALRLLT